MTRQQYCIANWKMNKTPSEGAKFVNNFKIKDLYNSQVKIILCPPYPTLISVKEELIGGIELGAQNVHFETKGAFTGEVSTSMLKDLSCVWVILGHSERRHVFLEEDEIIQKKLVRVLKDGLHPILCIGETLTERESGKTETVLESQLNSALDGVDSETSNLVIAYEPVWAIGTGRTASLDMIADAHKTVRRILSNLGFNGQEISVLYGGSVNPDNAEELNSIDEIDGFLIGGASLKEDSFYQIYRSFK